MGGEGRGGEGRGGEGRGGREGALQMKDRQRPRQRKRKRERERGLAFEKACVKSIRWPPRVGASEVKSFRAPPKQNWSRRLWRTDVLPILWRAHLHKNVKTELTLGEERARHDKGIPEFRFPSRGEEQRRTPLIDSVVRVQRECTHH